MNQKLKNILDLIQQSEKLDAEQKDKLLKAIKDADKELEITAFKLERTEKVKKTTAILLEETIEELEQKRKAVEAQNRELEIEAALERVRSLALGMHNSEEVGNVTDKLFEELNTLTLKVIACTIVVIDEKKDTWELWRARTKAVVKPFEIASFKKSMQVLKKHMPKWYPVFNEALSSRKKYLIEEMSKERRNQLLNSTAEQYNYTEQEKTKLLKFTPDKITAHFLFFKLGYLALMTENRLSDENLAVARKFVEVFDFAYTRFWDIKNAEAQARGAEIELALERVRARSMAMQKSEELKEVIKLVYEQFVHLKINVDHAGFVVDYTPKEDWHFWIADQQDIPSKITHPYFDSVWAHQFNEAKEKGIDFFATNLNFEEKNKFYNELLSYVPGLPDKSKDFYLSCPGLAISTVLQDNVGLYIENFSGIPYSDDENKILLRFGKVFQQTYTRFLDLQKAETQAREAQIQLALEKVRMVALGLNKSEEMLEVAKALYEQLLELGFTKIRNAIIDIKNGDDDTFTDYDYSHEMSGTITQMSYHDDPTLEGQFKKMATTIDDFFELVLEGKELEDLVNMRLKNGEAQDPRLLNIDLLTYNLYSFGNGAIGISNFGVLSAEEKSILNRFSNVFTFAYKRYNDLASAETQAREAQIEASLEKVRAVAMSMHKSDDLLSVGKVLFEELQRLGFKDLRNSLINIFNDEKRSFVNYDYSDYLGSSISNVLYDSHPANEEFVNQIRKNIDEFVETVINKNQLNEWKEFRRSHGEKDDPRLDNIDALYYYNYSIESGSIGISTFKTIGEEQLGILKRFRNVFNLSYQRYTDISRAERQAREAQIEAALERVRSRTMAMQSSNEIVEILGKIFNELAMLDIYLLRCMIWIFNPEENYVNWWMANPEAENKAVSYRMKYNDHPVFNAHLEAWENRERIWTYKLTGNDKISWDKILFEASGLRKLPQEVIKGMCAPKTIYLSNSCNDFGILRTGSETPLSEENLSILKQFGRVFEQSYKRFIDVQKAEAQTREAQIEASLEKVRAVAMSMNKSEDLLSICEASFKEFKKLGFENIRNALIHIQYDEQKYFMDYDFSDLTGGAISKIEYGSHPVVEDYLQQINSAEDAFYQGVIKEDQLEEWKEFRKNSGQIDDPRLEKATAIYYYFFSIGVGDIGISTLQPIDEPQIKILKRFRNVFDLAYRRYNDIALAEEQARETQIQLALERVRARTMAMHKSEELSETSFVLFEQLKELGEVADQMSITIYDEKEESIKLYSTIYGNKWEEMGRLPFNKNNVLKKIYNAWKEKKESIVIDLSGKELDDFNKFKMEHSTQYKSEEELPKDRWVMHYVFFSNGAITFSSHEPRPPETIHLLERFAGVFDLTYTRFLDLQKAESQAREAQIEAALESVRSRSMAMHHTSELQDVINTVHQQFKRLDIAITGGAFIAINEENKNEITCWGAGGTADYIERVHIPFLDKPIYTGLIECIQKGPGLCTEEFSYKEKIEFFNYLFERPPYSESSPEHKKEILSRQGGYTRSSYVSKYTCVFIINHHGRKFSVEENNILIRFGKVFEQSYTRFLDLQKAEAQAREAQIEAALERVRSKAMAMHNSNDISNAMGIVFEELENLSVKTIRCGILIIDDEKHMDVWTAASNSSNKSIKAIDRKFMGIHPLLDGAFTAWKNQQQVYTYELRDQDLKDYYQAIITSDYVLPEQHRNTQIQFFTLSLFTEGGIFTFSEHPLPDQSNIILRRITGVFDLTYRRYLDLKQAEAQAREAQIEAALERVRSKTMAMHNSKDVGATVIALFDEVLKLGLDKSIRVGIGILEGNEGMETWSATSTPDGKVDLKMGMLDMTIHPMLIGLKKAWESGETGYSYDYIGDDVFRYYQALNNEPDYPFRADLNSLPENEYHKSFFYREGILFSFAPNPISDEAAKVLGRFAGVFGQTYRRYLDLQKAEEQAREAQVEAALERVRSKAMAMHSSEDLGLTVDTFFSELNRLNISPHRCGVGIVDRETRIVKIQAIDTNQNNEKKKIVGDLQLAGHPVLDKIFESWVKQVEYFPVLRGKEILEYYKVMNPQVKFHEFADDEVQYGYYFQFKEGGVYAWTGSELQERDIEIFRRYTSVLSLTYRRYLDLKDAEARAIESVRQSSLDRVRAEIASMRTSEDLNRITPVIWQELKTLGVPFFRCGVYIVDEKNESVHVYLTTPDGKSLGVLNLLFDSSKVTAETVEHWQKKMIYKTHWSKEEFIRWTQSMIKIGQIKNAETYQGSAEPPESLYLHFIPFAQGMLYVGDVQPLTDEKLQLVKTLAEAFSIAYARYEDFRNLEEAKNKIEITLSELKSAQAQLVHSEKMASLGELTAGIAHEIKNPLNFVNNFSEVSRELLDEMQIELKNKNIEDVIDLVEDLKQNLDKINQHGKRADSIVKGMLLHSRGTSGEKTPTDINDLLDQYVNLAYHGMRATNKEFNITIEKDYDKSLEKINVVPQDISRVFLNIINNACYAAFDKKNKSENNYSPTLKVSTKKANDKVEIKIGDNGNGIPADHLDKIFQPFFTTKPSGEGTGLGLSLSYDIVTKAHGGEMKVETKEGEFTEFIITLPKLNEA